MAANCQMLVIKCVCVCYGWQHIIHSNFADSGDQHGSTNQLHRMGSEFTGRQSLFAPEWFARVPCQVVGLLCKSARCFKHCCQAATVGTFCCCTHSICMLSTGVDSRPWTTGQCWYDMLNMYIDTTPQMLAMLASRCWLYILHGSVFTKCCN